MELSLILRSGRVKHLFFFLLLFFFLFLFFFLNLSWGTFASLLIIVGGLWVSGLLAWALAEPLGQLGLGPLLPFIVFLLPQSLKVLCSYNFPAAFVKFPPVLVCSCVSSALILGIHANLWWVLASQGLGIQSLLHGLLSELLLLPLLQLFEIVILSLLAFLKIVLFSLQPNNGFPKFGGFALELFVVHGVKIQRLDADGQGDLLLLFQLLLSLGHLATSILNIAHSAVSLLDGSLGALSGSLLLLLLSLHHGLPLFLCLLQALPLLFGLLGLLVSLFLAQSLLLLFLLLSQLLLLLSSDFFPLGLFLLQPLEFFLFLCPLFSPLVDVFAELLIQLALLGLLTSLQEVSISLFRGVGSNFLLLIVFLVRHGDGYILCATLKD